MQVCVPRNRGERRNEQGEEKEGKAYSGVGVQRNRKRGVSRRKGKIVCREKSPREQEGEE